MNFLLVSLYEIGKNGTLALCTTAHLVYASTKHLPNAYAPRTISTLHPRAPPKLPGHKDCVDFFDAFELNTGRSADRGFSFLCDRAQAKAVRSRALELRHKLARHSISPLESQEALDLVLECHVGFLNPDETRPRKQDWFSVGLMTDCLWAVNEIMSVEANDAYRFFSTTVSLAIHFFPPLPEVDVDGYLLARATITHLAGGLSELEALIWTADGERLLATGRQTCLTDRHKRVPPVKKEKL
jgi:hypothetical protein